MTLKEKLIRLRVLGYHAEPVQAQSNSGATREIHFVHPKDVKRYIDNGKFSLLGKRHEAAYIYDCVTESWTKERSPLEAMPLTDTERVLYAD